MQQIQNIILKNNILIALSAALFIWILFATGSHAATFEVVAGDGNVSNDSQCNIAEAIININDSTQTHDDCVEVGAYGVNDTINLPSGTITLINDIPPIAQSVIIQGQGIDASIFDQNGNWGFRILGGQTNKTLTIRDVKIAAFKGTGVGFDNNSLVLERVEIDGTNGAHDGLMAGVGVINGAGLETTAVLKDVYIHSIPAIAPSATMGIFIGSVSNSTINISLDRVTIADINDSSPSGVTGINLLTGIIADFSPGNVYATIKNTTITNVTSDTQQSNALSMIAGVDGGETTIAANVNNITISDIQGVSNSDAINVAGVAVNASDKANARLNLINSIIDGSCAVGQFTAMGVPAGEHDLQFNSLGGNLSNDSSCNTYLNHSSDQRSVSNLTSTLGALSDNGGAVPTMALLADSPAIDSGVVVAGLTNDARGVLRPQGTAHDSGAYESAYSRTRVAGATAMLADTGENIRFALLGICILLGIGGFGLIVRKSAS